MSIEVRCIEEMLEEYDGRWCEMYVRDGVTLLASSDPPGRHSVKVKPEDFGSWLNLLRHRSSLFGLRHDTRPISTDSSASVRGLKTTFKNSIDPDDGFVLRCCARSFTLV